ncbi:MAG: hypothetical protein GC181_08940 [Bacteroidetes bacterium]|nr:hypothetical protein [Bacteroidota bacterium]
MIQRESAPLVADINGNQFTIRIKPNTITQALQKEIIIVPGDTSVKGRLNDLTISQLKIVQNGETFTLIAIGKNYFNCAIPLIKIKDKLYEADHNTHPYAICVSDNNSCRATISEEGAYCDGTHNCLKIVTASSAFLCR